jgi:hypothetical protein
MLTVLACPVCAADEWRAGGSVVASRTIGGTYGQWKRLVARALVRHERGTRAPRMDRAAR